MLGVADELNDIWIWDLDRETLSRLTFDDGFDGSGEWTPDGQKVIFSSDREGDNHALFWRAADDTGTAERLTEAEAPLDPMAVAPDSSVVVVAEGAFSTDRDLIIVALTGDPVSEDLLRTEFGEQNAAISPDGQWFAYESNASGEWEVYVRPFPDAEGGLQQVSAGGGRSPQWAPDGNELFYANGGRLFSAPVETEPTFARGTPTVIIEGNYMRAGGNPGRHYDIDPTGDRFLMLKVVGAADALSNPSLTVVLNWTEQLRESVPVP